MAIKSRKHAPTRFNQHIGAALAVMLLPVAAQAADPAGQSAPASQQTLNEIKVVGSKENDFKAEKPRRRNTRKISSTQRKPSS